MQPLAVTWPAVIKIDGDTELTFIPDQTEWEQNAAHHHFQYRDNDMLIDSAGRLFSLTTRVNGCAVPIPANRALTLDEITTLVRAHAAQTGSCCVEKIIAPSIDNIIKLVESLEA